MGAADSDEALSAAEAAGGGVAPAGSTGPDALEPSAREAPPDQPSLDELPQLELLPPRTAHRSEGNLNWEAAHEAVLEADADGKEEAAGDEKEDETEEAAGGLGAVAFALEAGICPGTALAAVAGETAESGTLACAGPRLDDPTAAGTAISLLPQELQNLLPSGFSVPQFQQNIYAPSDSFVYAKSCTRAGYQGPP